MLVYVMRHGTTTWNEKEIIQGHSNNKLSKNGIELVEESAQKHSKTRFDIIYSSPLMRTMQTANIMNRFHNVKIVKDNRLIEADEGFFTRKSKRKLTQDEICAQNYRLKEFGMESWQSVHYRMENFVNFIKQNCQYENLLVVTHDLPATCLENILLNKKVDYKNILYSKNFNNAEVRRYEIF